MTREIPTAHIILLFLSNQPTLKQQVKQYWLMEIRFYVMCIVPSVLWCWWVGGRKGIWSVKKLEWCGAGVVICLGHTHTHTHTTVLRLCGICPGKPGWAGTRRNIHPLLSSVICHISFVWGMMQICICPSWSHCHSLSLAPWIQIGFGFTFVAVAHPGSPGKNAESHKTVVVVVVVTFMCISLCCWGN